MDDEQYDYRFQVVDVFKDGLHVQTDLNAIKEFWKNRVWDFDSEVHQPTDDSNKDELLLLFRQAK